MRSNVRIWPLVVVIAVLGFAFGGCGTLSSAFLSDHSMVADGAPVDSPLEPGTARTEASPAPVETVASTPDPPAAEAVPAATPGEPASESIAITYEPITAENAPGWVVALSGAVIGQAGTSDAPPQEQDIEEWDPWEPFNVVMFNFNYNLDKKVLRPVAKGYNYVMPDMFQIMIDNAFSNLKFPVRFVNKMLQWKVLDAAKEMGRFLVNSTLGVGGLFDVAKQEMGLEPQKADFGQTLGVWGFGPGPFLVLPLLRPLTVRDGIGFGVDGTMNILNYYIPFWPDQFAMSVGQTINERSLTLDLFQGIEQSTVDLYSAVRNAYLQRRQRLINEGR